MPEPTPEYRAHDHTVEDAFFAYVANPTEENALAAELAIADLQRRLDNVQRKLDGADTTRAGQSVARVPAPDPLDDLREVLAGQLAHLERHGLLYDAPGVEPEALGWAINEIERLRAQLVHESPQQP